jgi:hypothetical protein
MNQQDEEILIMHYFREHYKNFPKGKLEKSESPDFILRINPKKSFGIELTRLPAMNNFVDALYEILEKKEQKLSLYLGQGFLEIWLIIYTDDLQKYSRFNPNNKISNLNFQSSFDKVFLFDLFENKVYPIYEN